MSRKGEIVICRWCGKEFINTDGKNRLSCSKKCAYEFNRDYAHRAEKELRENDKQIKMMTKSSRKSTKTNSREMDQLTKDAIAAQKLGISYGKYIAFYKGKRQKQHESKMDRVS